MQRCAVTFQMRQGNKGGRASGPLALLLPVPGTFVPSLPSASGLTITSDPSRPPPPGKLGVPSFPVYCLSVSLNQRLSSLGEGIWWLCALLYPRPRTNKAPNTHSLIERLRKDGPTDGQPGPGRHRRSARRWSGLCQAASSFQASPLPVPQKQDVTSLVCACAGEMCVQYELQGLLGAWDGHLQLLGFWRGDDENTECCFSEHRLHAGRENAGISL